MDFYVLSLDTSRSSFGEFEPTTTIEFVDPPHCKKCNTKLAPLIRKPPHKYRLHHGKAGDLLTDGMAVAFSMQAIKLLLTSELKGIAYSETPIQLSDVDFSYYMVTPSITCTLLDEVASGVVVDELRGCDQCRVMATSKIDRIVLNERTWPGDDFFMMGNLFGVILVTKRFVEFVNQHKLTNFEFIHQDDFQEDFTFGLR